MTDARKGMRQPKKTVKDSQSPPHEDKKRSEWTANTDEVPGLRRDLDKTMLETNSKTHAVLLSKALFAYRHAKILDPFLRIMLKPDSECSGRELRAKEIIGVLYHIAGYNRAEQAEIFLEEINKVTDQFDNWRAEHPGEDYLNWSRRNRKKRGA